MATSVVFDIVVLVIIVGCALYYRRKGFVECMIGLASLVISLVGAYALSRWLAEPIFTNFFRESMIGKVSAVITQEGITTVNEVLAQIMGFLPEFLLDKIAGNAGGGFVQVSADMAAFVVDVAVAPLIIPVIKAGVFLVSFLLLRLICAVVGRIIVAAAHVPVVKGVNKTLGFVAGIVIGLLYTLLLVFVVWVLDAAYTPAQFGQQYLSSSIVYWLFSSWNPFV